VSTCFSEKQNKNIGEKRKIDRLERKKSRRKKGIKNERRKN
jgi:hypothetical protein